MADHVGRRQTAHYVCGQGAHYGKPNLSRYTGRRIRVSRSGHRGGKMAKESTPTWLRDDLPLSVDGYCLRFEVPGLSVHQTIMLQ